MCMKEGGKMSNKASEKRKKVLNTRGSFTKIGELRFDIPLYKDSLRMYYSK